MMLLMRTTIDLPDDLHEITRAIAHDSQQTLSETVAGLLRRALEAPSTSAIEDDELTGMPLIRLGRPITTDDVRAVDDDW
jgi:hypothetical protein